MIEKFHVTVQNAQLHLFVFLGAVAIGTFAGGPIGDRFGRKPVIWFSIVGALPFALLLPYAGLLWTGALSVTIGLIIASAFSAIIVYAQELLLPGRVGMVAGMMFGFSFGSGGLGCGGTRPDRRRDRDRVRVSRVLVPAGDRLADRLPAE